MSQVVGNAREDTAHDNERSVVLRRIVVAVDASPASLMALRSAAQLAALLDVELEGLFVEDANLLMLCGFPFCGEIGSYSGRLRPLESRGIERQLRATAKAIEQAIQTVAHGTPFRWHFHVRRGQVVEELLSAAQEASLMGLGRASQLRRGKLGSTVRSMVERSKRPLLILGEEDSAVTPLTVIYTGTPAAKRALMLASDLARRHEEELRVLRLPAPDEVEAPSEAEVTAQVGTQSIRFISPYDILPSLHQPKIGTLVLPSDRASLITESDGPMLLVP